MKKFLPLSLIILSCGCIQQLEDKEMTNSKWIYKTSNPDYMADKDTCEVVHDSFPGLYGSYKTEEINIILNKPLQGWQQAKKLLRSVCSLSEGGFDRDLNLQTLKPWSLTAVPPSLFRKIKIKKK